MQQVNYCEICHQSILHLNNCTMITILTACSLLC
jgi:hypothetical protein